MPTRYLDTGFFRSPYVRSLKAPLKLLYGFIICDCTGAGIWTKDLSIAAAYTDGKVTEDDFKKHFIKPGKAVDLKDGKFFFPDFIEHQYPQGLQATNPAQKNFIKELQKYNLLDENLKVNIKPLPRGIGRGISNSIGNSNGNGNGNGNGENSLFGTFSLTEREKKFADEVKTFTEEFPEETLTTFFNHWSAPGPGEKMRFETEKFWDTKKRLQNWLINSNKFSKNGNTTGKTGAKKQSTHHQDQQQRLHAKRAGH